MDFAKNAVLVDGAPVELQALDLRLLRYFIANRGRVLTREQILDRIWGLEYEGSDRVVDTHIKKLRKALGRYGSHIETVIKEGYRFVP